MNVEILTNSNMLSNIRNRFFKKFHDKIFSSSSYNLFAAIFGSGVLKNWLVIPRILQNETVSRYIPYKQNRNLYIWYDANHKGKKLETSDEAV